MTLATGERFGLCLHLRMLLKEGQLAGLNPLPLIPDNESPAVGNAQAVGAQASALNRPRVQETPHQGL